MNITIYLLKSAAEKINYIIWSPFTLLIILGAGLYFSVRTGFLQFFKIGSIIKNTVGKSLKEDPAKTTKGSISPFQALSTALAGTIGTGNIAGVATAITIAGPGAIFWMWFSAILGMMTKYAEIVLAIKYRRKNSKGEWTGGPMFFIEKGLKMRWLAFAYALLGAICSFGVGNITQANSISSAIGNAFNINPLTTGIVLSITIGICVAGGVKKIASITEKLVPFMSVFYLLSALIVILFNFKTIPEVMVLIIESAFKPIAPIGGFMGATVATSIQKGVSRGIFSNEAGLGSASIAHAAADTNHPFSQGLWGIFEVFFDTIVVCSITAIAILVTGEWTSDLTGSPLTIAAFDTVLLGAGKYIISISLTLFAFTSILAWSFYGRKCVEYAMGEKYITPYMVIFLITLVIGAIAEINVVWEVSDSLNGLMVIPNLIGLIGLRRIVVDCTRDGLRKHPLK